VTEKLYEVDSYVQNFTAQVVSCTPVPGGFAVVLDRTAFFPEGGGQPCDTGRLGGARVLAVFGSIYRLLVRRGLPPDTPSDAPEFAAFLQSCVPTLEPQDAEALLALAQAAQFGAGTMTEQDTDKMRKLYQVIKHTGKRKQSQKSVEKQSQE